VDYCHFGYNTEFDPPPKKKHCAEQLHQGGRFSQIWLQTKKNLKKN